MARRDGRGRGGARERRTDDTDVGMVDILSAFARASRHCPHEEDAEAFVDAISRWMDVSNGHETAGDGESASRRAEVAASAGS